MMLAALALWSGAAAAADNRSRAVDYSDLDLLSQNDVARLQVRVRNAARSLCGPVERRDFEDRQAYRDCVARSVGDADGSIRTAVEAVRSGRVQSAALTAAPPRK
jgi:UrcA family protein